MQRSMHRQAPSGRSMLPLRRSERGTSRMPYAANDGLRIHYEVAGSGEPLVLYHGLTGSGERWRDTGYVASLSDTYHLILIDARGHGGSDNPHDWAAYGRRRQATGSAVSTAPASASPSTSSGHPLRGGSGRVGLC